MDCRVGVDIGGTFTDGIAILGEQVSIAKVPSRPSDPSRAVLDCIRALNVDLASVSLLVHGSTIATNAIIEKKSAAIAHITTLGFRDVLHIGRGASMPYQLDWRPPEPIVRRRDVFEVDERISARGEVVRRINDDELQRIATIICERGYPAVSVTLLNSYANPIHEARVASVLREVCEHVAVCTSVDVLPHYREFERASTTAANAYLTPAIGSYLGALSDRLRDEGYRGELLVMQSNGGLATPVEAGRLPAKLVRSGPAGGAIAAADLVAPAAADDHAILIDIGGTSTEVALLKGGRPSWTAQLEYTWGVPIRFPAVDIESIGAGGGSIGWIDAGRFLKVGPHSAGADPGPVCYGRGGTHATTTDAQVVLGRLNQTALLDGQMPISRDLAYDAVHGILAAQLGTDAESAARSMVQVATHNIVQAIRRLTVNRGIDPRAATLIAYGGNGPLFAADVAELLGMSKVLVPLYPGINSAIGMILADYQYDKSKTLLVGEAELDFDSVEDVFSGFEDELSSLLRRARVEPDDQILERYLDIRYDGQGYELPVPLPRREYEEVSVPIGSKPFSKALFDEIRARFHEDHEREYGWSDESWPTEVVFARVVARGVIRPKPHIHAVDHAQQGDPTPQAVRSCAFPIQGAEQEAAVWKRTDLPLGFKVEGPSLIEQLDATTIVPSGWTASVDDSGNLILMRVESELEEKGGRQQ